MSKKGRGGHTWASSPHWTEAEARAALDALESSGLPVAAFAARHGVGAYRLYAWRRRLRSAVDCPRFVEVPTNVVAGTANIVFEIVLPTGEVIRVPQHADTRALEGVLSALRATRC